MASSHVTVSIPVTVCQVMRFPDGIRTYPHTSRMLNHVFAPRNRLKEGKEQRINHLQGGLTISLFHFSPFRYRLHHWRIIGRSLGHRLSANLSHHLQGTWALLSFFYSCTSNSLYSFYFIFYSHRSSLYALMHLFPT
jgi:hypothetical protein